MSRKHNTLHRRSRSHYKDRLAARGLSSTPRMRWTGLDPNQFDKALREAAERASRKEAP